MKMNINPITTKEFKFLLQKIYAPDDIAWNT